MKLLYSTLGLIILSATAIFAQQTDKSKQSNTTDWSALFPTIAGCGREIQPLKQNGKVFEQTANYFRCGSITLRFEPSARKTAREKSSVLDFPMNVPTKVKDFEAYQSSPLCGNDDWIGSTAVYFDENQVLIVSAYMGGAQILEFAQNADYGLLKKSINKIVRRQIKQDKSKL